MAMVWLGSSWGAAGGGDDAGRGFGLALGLALDLAVDLALGLEAAFWVLFGPTFFGAALVLPGRCFRDGRVPVLDWDDPDFRDPDFLIGVMTSRSYLESVGPSPLRAYAFQFIACIAGCAQRQMLTRKVTYSVNFR